MDIGAWAQPPPKTTDNKELSFADQVPMALRLSLAHTVASQPFDEARFAYDDGGDRPHIPEDWQPDPSLPPGAGGGAGDQEEVGGPGTTTRQRPSSLTGSTPSST